MRVVIQRVKKASVEIDGNLISKINKGILVFVGIKTGDSLDQCDYLINKILNLRIFEDENQTMNKSVLDLNLEILFISQFTLYSNCKKGNRPSFINAMPPTQAKNFYQEFFAKFKQRYANIKDGEFGAYMKVSLINDGPVTIILDSSLS